MSDSVIAGVGDEVLVTLCCGAVLVVIAGLWSFKADNQQQEDARAEFMRAGPTYNTDSCPICLGGHVLAVETNCGHKFCGQCINNYLELRAPSEYSIFSGRLNCPMCRQEINILLLSFTPEELHSTQLAPERVQVERTVRAYNVVFARRNRSLWSYIRDCPVLVRHLMNGFFSYGGLVLMFKLRVIFCVLATLVYVVFPVDLVPEALFGIFGLLDDVIIMFLCAIYVSILYRRYILSRGGLNQDQDS